jgi:hypothetical protein
VKSVGREKLAIRIKSVKIWGTVKTIVRINTLQSNKDQIKIICCQVGKWQPKPQKKAIEPTSRNRNLISTLI